MNTTLDGKTFFKSSFSTPENIDLFDMMAQAVKNGRTHLVMEVSSQAYLVKSSLWSNLSMWEFSSTSLQTILVLLSIRPLKITSTTSVS